MTRTARVWLVACLVLASAACSTAFAADATQDALSQATGDPMLQMGLQALKAIGLFIGGWVVAKMISYGLFVALKRTSLDTKVARRLGLTALFRGSGASEQDAETSLERFIAQLVFYVLMLLVVVAVLEFSGLEQVAAPLQGIVDTLAQALPRVGKALLILVVAWAIGKGLEVVVGGVLATMRLDRRFAELARAPSPQDSMVARSFSKQVGRIVFWLIMVTGLAGAFEALQIAALASPLHNAIDAVVSLVPRMVGAVVVVLLAYVGGRIIRAILRNVLESVGFDRLVARLKLDRFLGTTTASDLVGLVAMIFVLMHAGIEALRILQLTSLSQPLNHMMAQFWDRLPGLTVSAVIVLLGVFVSQLARSMLAGALRGVEFDGLMQKLGFRKLAEREDRLGEYSELVGLLAQVAIVLLAVAQALDNLALATWAVYVGEVLRYLIKNITVAFVVVGVGFATGNYVRALVVARTSGNEVVGNRWLGEFARSTILVFAFTMAVQQLDVADDFVRLTFGLLFGALCLAVALALGLGGRDLAAEILRSRYEELRNRKPPT